MIVWDESIVHNFTEWNSWGVIIDFYLHLNEKINYKLFEKNVKYVQETVALPFSLKFIKVKYFQ